MPVEENTMKVHAEHMRKLADANRKANTYTEVETTTTYKETQFLICTPTRASPGSG